MPSIEKQSIRVPETGIPEIVINSVDNGWVVSAGRPRDGEYGFSRSVAAFESFDSMSRWLKGHIEDNTAKSI